MRLRRSDSLHRGSRRIGLTACVCAVLLLAMATSAAGQNPTAEGYGPTVVIAPPPPPPPPPAAPNPTAEGYSPTAAITPPPPPAGGVFGATNGSKPAGQYGGSKPAGQVTSAAATPAAAARSTLPFTGADVGAVVLAALILLLLGAVLRRSTREQG